jgi:hypothetical protein
VRALADAKQTVYVQAYSFASAPMAKALVVRSVRSSGEIKWQGQRMYLGEVLADENVGLEPIMEGGWCTFARCRLGCWTIGGERCGRWRRRYGRAGYRRTLCPPPSAALHGPGRAWMCKQGSRLHKML